ncbi:MAG: type I restriction enzyme HsdR N-terminal domain-containing protein, partial [Chloroflexi bacterium]|nr:type I restriction enzyme HsdR N-terminal domain-containing protein [Chloroflexota bacterium]
MPPTNEADARVAIDDLLRAAGWDPANKFQVTTEVVTRVRAAGEDETYARVPSGRAVREMLDGANGRADYVLLDRQGRPLAVIEAKRSAIHPYTAKRQALPYAKQLGAPFIFLTNGELIYFWDYTNDDARLVDSFYSQRDLERLLHLRRERQPLATVPIPESYVRQSEARTLRPYQREAMRALDGALELGRRRFLMELPTGTGK